LVYFDSSALVKLAIDERESSNLHSALDQWSDVVTSLVSQIELSRALYRATVASAQRGDPRQWEQLRDRARMVLSRVTLLALDQQVVGLAEAIQPFSLRSLDAIHLATALSLGQLEGLVTYDARLAEAATVNGLKVISPGR
jgi:uncharacterized protein